MTGGDPTTSTLAGITANLNKVDDISGAPAMDASNSGCIYCSLCC